MNAEQERLEDLLYVLDAVRHQHEGQQVAADKLDADIHGEQWTAAGHAHCHKGRGELLAVADGLVELLNEAHELLGRFANDSDAFRMGEQHERARVLRIIDREEERWSVTSVVGIKRLLVDIGDAVANVGPARQLPIESQED